MPPILSLCILILAVCAEASINGVYEKFYMNWNPQEARSHRLRWDADTKAIREFRLSKYGPRRGTPEYRAAYETRRIELLNSNAGDEVAKDEDPFPNVVIEEEDDETDAQSIIPNLEKAGIQELTTPTDSGTSANSKIDSSTVTMQEIAGPAHQANPHDVGGRPQNTKVSKEQIRTGSKVENTTIQAQGQSVVNESQIPLGTHVFSPNSIASPTEPTHVPVGPPAQDHPGHAVLKNNEPDPLDMNLRLHTTSVPNANPVNSSPGDVNRATTSTLPIHASYGPSPQPNVPEGQVNRRKSKFDNSNTSSHRHRPSRQSSRGGQAGSKVAAVVDSFFKVPGNKKFVPEVHEQSKDTQVLKRARQLSFNPKSESQRRKQGYPITATGV